MISLTSFCLIQLLHRQSRQSELLSLPCARLCVGGGGEGFVYISCFVWFCLTGWRTHHSRSLRDRADPRWGIVAVLLEPSTFWKCLVERRPSFLARHLHPTRRPRSRSSKTANPFLLKVVKYKTKQQDYNGRDWIPFVCFFLVRSSQADGFRQSAYHWRHSGGSRPVHLYGCQSHNGRADWWTAGTQVGRQGRSVQGQTVSHDLATRGEIHRTNWYFFLSFLFSLNSGQSNFGSIFKGQNVTLECAASGWPKPQIRWSREGNRPLPHNRSYQLGGGALVVTTLAEQDEGGYICEASNGAISPTLRASTLLQLTEPVSMVKTPKDARVEEGTRISLECQARGRPPPQTYWVFNGNTVDSDPYITVTGILIHFYPFKLFIY